MKQKNRSFFYLLTFTMLLFSFSSIFAAVTVTYQPGSFPYNTTGNVITARVVTDEAIAAFDLMTKVKSTVNNAFGVITAVNVSSVSGAVADMSKVDAACIPENGVPVGEEDFTRIYGFLCGTPIIMPVGTYDFTFTVTTCCDTGAFMLEDGGDWMIDPDPVVATTMFVNTSAAAATVTVNAGTYRVINRPPVITNPSTPDTTLVFNACDIVTFDFDASDPDNFCRPAADFTWAIVTGPGGINVNTGEYLWNPPAVTGICGLHEVTVKVTDEYGAFDTYDMDISLWSDPPSFTECPSPGSETQIYWGWTADGAVAADDPDDCPLALRFSVNSFSGPEDVGPFAVDSVTGVWSWPTAYGDDAYLGEWTVVIDVTDGCHTASCTFTIKVLPTYIVEIEKTHNSYQGHYEWVDITLKHWTYGMGGFDFLVAYDASALSVFEVTPGSILTDCEWEYFTYRHGLFGNCGGPCPTGQLRIVALADQNNGGHHPLCWGENVTGTLAVIKFLVTNDRTFECMFVPVSFLWFDCGDNAISSTTGDTLFISRAVYGWGVPPYEITGEAWYGGWQGTGYNCMSLLLQKYYPDTVIDFYDGGVDIPCADSIDARGDINVNGIANEIADAVMFTNFFLHGYDALPVVGREGAIAASDVNADGRTLTVADLVYLLRIIVGDALPFPKLAPFSSNADISVVGGKVSTTSSETIGALYMTFNVTGNYSVVNHTNMEVVSSLANDGLLHVLVYSGITNMRNGITAGTTELLTVTGAELSSVEVSDYYGNLMNTRVEKTALPTQFALLQNVPNPFNPTTKIGLDLPVVSDWRIDIYNVNGQLVQSYNGTNIGHIEVTWDAKDAASGVYFYKARAGSYTDTKKMILMK